MGIKRFFFVNSKRLNISGDLDILQMVQLRFVMERDDNACAFKIDAREAGHEAILALILKSGLEGPPPFLEGLRVTGKSGLKINALIDDNGGWSVKGRWKAAIPSLEIPQLDFKISDLDIDLPIDLASSTNSSTPPGNEQYGRIFIRYLSVGKWGLESFDLSPLFSQNRFRIPGPVSFNLWEGKVLLDDINADAVLSPDAAFYASIWIQGIKLQRLLEASGFLLTGRLDGAAPLVRYKNGRLDIEGSLNIKTLGGHVRAEDLYIENPFTRGRKAGGEIFWEGIQLDQLTRKIPIGKISGVIKGKLTGLEIEYGQPSKFLLEVESMKQKGVRQTISVDAISNLSLIGTGSTGVKMVMNSGLNRFFSYYPYKKIGFRCTLENDIFSLRGLIRQGGREFLIKKGLLRGIDMVNQNPENIISFKDMKERINRIFEERQMQKQK